MSGIEAHESSNAVWQHDLRNAVNAAALAIAAGKHLLVEGHHERAMETMDRAELALRRIAALVDMLPAAGDASPGGTSLV